MSMGGPRHNRMVAIHKYRQCIERHRVVVRYVTHVHGLVFVRVCEGSELGGKKAGAVTGAASVASGVREPTVCFNISL